MPKNDPRNYSELATPVYHCHVLGLDKPGRALVKMPGKPGFVDVTMAYPYSGLHMPPLQHPAQLPWEYLESYVFPPRKIPAIDIELSAELNTYIHMLMWQNSLANSLIVSHVNIDSYPKFMSDATPELRQLTLEGLHHSVFIWLYTYMITDHVIGGYLAMQQEDPDVDKIHKSNTKDWQNWMDNRRRNILFWMETWAERPRTQHKFQELWDSHKHLKVTWDKYMLLWEDLKQTPDPGQYLHLKPQMPITIEAYKEITVKVLAWVNQNGGPRLAQRQHRAIRLCIQNQDAWMARATFLDCRIVATTPNCPASNREIWQHLEYPHKIARTTASYLDKTRLYYYRDDPSEWEVTESDGILIFHRNDSAWKPLDDAELDAFFASPAAAAALAEDTPKRQHRV